MTEEIHIVTCKARGIGDQIVPDGHLRITDSIPEYKIANIYDIASLDAMFDTEAQKIADMLLMTLPGGLFDRLLGKMLTIKASHFVVPWHKYAKIELRENSDE